MSEPRRYTLTLPVPPSSNKWWRRAGTHMHKSNEARAYQKMVAGRMLLARVTPIRRPNEVKVEIVWYRERRSGDVDKRQGVVLDALQGTAYENDGQIRTLWATRVDGDDDPRMEITITEIPAA